MKQKIFIFVIFTISFYTNVQVKTTIFPEGNGFNEFPMLNQVYLENIPIYEIQSFNLDSVLQYEAELDEKGVGRPFRFGYAFDVDYGIEHGKWDTVEDKNIWSIRFKSKDAYSLNFKLSDLKLDNKSELYIYNSEGTIVYGPVTYKENSTKEFNSIGTDLIAGEEAIIQIIEPKTSTKTSTTRIMMVVHGFENLYRDILLYKNKDKNNFQSLHWHNNIMCYPTFDNVSRGVARVMVGNISICSGALLNNKAGTNRPFILTAKHCVGSCNKTLSNLDKNYIEDWNFQFNYKRNCNNSLVSYVSVNYSGCQDVILELLGGKQIFYL